MTPVVRDEIGGLVTGPDVFGVRVQKNGGLDFPRVHVGEQRSGHPRPLPSRLPVLHGREQRHPFAACGGLLDDVAQYVVPAVPVDHHQGVDARAAQRVGYVPYHRVKGHRGDADGPRPVRVLVGAADRHRWEQVHRVRGGDLPGDGARDERVGRQRQVRAVLFEASDRQHRHLSRNPGAPPAHVFGRVRRHQ
ncbi:hypothetical protein GCM10023323_54790 [Streptomyces thinghirensis]|uniref:Uncharacterized protein n=1 Tax=Streptomyces thinghirensis TaxID=551547 RepID=A0ABP9T8X9_9ACTN